MLLLQIKTPSKRYLQLDYLSNCSNSLDPNCKPPFYREQWFLVALAAASIVIIIVVVAILCVKSKSYKYKGKPRLVVYSIVCAVRVHFFAVTYS